MFSRQTITASVDELKNIFSPYMEREKHSIFHFCAKDYSSPRKGIHAYIKSNRISGYYESGETNRNGHLMRAKSWFFLRVKERENALKVRLVAFPEPMMLLLGWAVLIDCAIRLMIQPSSMAVFELLFGGGIIVVLLMTLASEMNTLENAVKDILAKLNSKNTSTADR